MTRIKKLAVKTMQMLGAILILNFVSCQNFLDAKDVKQQVEEAIAYNNAKSVSVAIECEKDMGTIFPAPNYTAKVGYNFEIQFIPNLTDNIIIDPQTILQAVSRINREESRSEYVEFSVKEQDLEDARNGLYRINVKVISPADDILIMPACYVIPKVSSVSPEFKTSGVPANTNVTVSFNTPMDFQSLKDNIVITAKDNNNTIIQLDDCFEAPVFSSDETRLTLIPKVQNIIDLMKRPRMNPSFVDVQFMIRQDAKSQTELSLTQNEYSTFTVRFNPNVEKTSPEKKDLFASREQMSFENRDSSKEFDLTLTEEIGSLSRNDYHPKVKQNRSTGKVYIYGRYQDLDSGVKTIVISEKNTRDIDAKIISDPVIFDTEYIVDNSYQNSWITTEAGITSFCIEYNLKSKTGFVLLTVTAYDACGNKSESTDIPVIAVNQSNYNKTWIHNFTTDPLFWASYNVNKTLTNFNTDKKTLYIGYYNSGYEMYNDVKEYIYYKKASYPVKFTTTDLLPYSYCEYKHKDGQVRKDDFEYYSDGFKVDLDVNNLSGLEVKIVIADDIGNACEQTICFPGEPEDVYYSGDGKSIKCISSSEKLIYYPIEINGQTQTLRAEGGELSSGFSYKLLPIYDISTDAVNLSLFGDIGTTVYNRKTISSQDKPAKVTLVKKDGKEYEISRATETGKLNVKLSVAASEWNKYDSIYVYVVDEYGNFLADTTYFSKETNSVSFVLDNQQMYDYQTELYITGVKNSIVSDEYEVDIEPIEEMSDELQKKYDNLAPKANWVRSKYNVFLFFMQELRAGSGPKSAYLITKNNKKILVADKDTGFENITIPVKQIENDAKIQNVEYGGMIFTAAMFEVSDNNENTTTVFLPIWRAGDTIIPVQDFRKDASGKYWFYHSEMLSGTSYNISELTFNQTSWSSATENGCPGFQTGDSPWEQYFYTRYKYNITAADNTWVRLILKKSIWTSDAGYIYSYSVPKYFYAGDKSSGEYDYVLEYNEKSKLIASDTPVLVHTLVTDKSYQECSNWTVEEWEANGKEKNIKYLYFDEDTTNPKKYTINADEIDANMSYVVIVHFASNETYISEVLQK